MEDKTEEKIFISGTIERITYHNQDNGFCVLRVKAKGFRDLVTVVGSVSILSGGEYIEAVGSWKNDAQYGLQLAAFSIKTSAPTSMEGIQKYLASGLIKGIGEVYATKMVSAFGTDVFEIIEKDPNRLTEVDGIGKVRREKIVNGWETLK